VVAQALADDGLDRLVTGITNGRGQSPSLRRVCVHVGACHLIPLRGRVRCPVFPGGVIVVRVRLPFTLGCVAMISDDTLRQMTREERVGLSRRLAALDSTLPSLSEGDERRRRFVVLLTGASLALVPWIVLLALTLPRRYLAGHWTLTWVGFDIVLLSGLALTAWLAWHRRQAVVITAFITATLLTCDAWFDVTTASGRADIITAVASALLLELPLAGLLFAVASHLLRLSAHRAQAADGFADAPSGLLQVPLFGVPRKSRAA
jgi:hypothetical protein